MTLRLTILFLFIQLTTNAQFIKKHEVGLMLISGAADGFNQAITHHQYGSGNKFFDQSVSWKNKYKNWPEDKREKFPGSKSALVFVTDAYHLTRFIDRTATTITIVLARNEYKKGLWYALSKMAVLTLINRFAFSMFFNVILK